MTALTEARVRAIVREELALQPELTQQPAQRARVVEPGTALQPLEPVLQADDRVDEHPEHTDTAALWAYLLLRVAGSGEDEASEQVARDFHGRWELIQEGGDRPRHVFIHNASPSLVVADTPTGSVGDRAASGAELRAHTPGAAHPDGGAR